jgi:fengycin family lipopeptide synthetase D
MKGSYQLNSFTENKISEVKRLSAQVELFFAKEFETYVKFGLKNGMKIIECGSGPGFLIKNILRILPDCDATALEIDPFLIEVLKENSVEDNAKLFEVRHASIYDTQLPDNTFDFAITRLVIEHLQSPLDAFKELNRILKPGGKLVIVSNDFAYHLLTYPIIPELDEMYKAYCQSRFSEGGNPLVGRQIPGYLKKERFSDIKFEIISVHSDLVGDKALLQAENVNISKSLVSEGFLSKETLDSLAANWYKMLNDPDHAIFRQLFVICGEKSLLVDSTAILHEEDRHVSDEVISGEFIGSDNGRQEDTIKLFLANMVKKVMGDKDLNVKNEEKLCDIDIDSIAAAELSSIVQTNFNKKVSISDILQKFSINDITKEILVSSEDSSGKNRTTREEDEKQDYVQENLSEISQIEEQFWILHKIYPKNTAYNIASALKVEGKINLNALERAINQIVARHEILKVSFYEKNNKVYQKVGNDAGIQYKIEVVDLQESFNDKSAREQISDEVHRTFDLTVWPLFRIKIFSFNDNISILTIVFHHIIIDLKSRQVFERELTELYNSYSSGKSVIEMAPVNKYSDYSNWLNNWIASDEARDKLEEWRTEIPQDLEILQVSPDFSKPKIDNLEGKRKFFTLDTNTSLSVSKFAKEHSVNAFTVLLAAYSILLNRLSNQSKIVIGVPLTNRRKIEFTETFGCFVNIVPVLVDFYENISGREILLQIRQTLLRVHRKQEIPFLIINNFLRNSGRNSVFQAGFTFEAPMHLNFNNLEIQPLVVGRNGSQLDLFITFWEEDNHFNGHLEYSTLLYEESSINRFIDIYLEIVHSLIENPNQIISEIPLISENDKKKLSEFNNTDAPYEYDLCIHQKFEHQVNENPDLPALFWGNQLLSYKELNDHSNRLANYLIKRGINIEDKVAVCVYRSIEMMISIFGVLKAGAAYLPLSPENPLERLKSIIYDSNPKLILSSKVSSANIPEGSPVVFIDDILREPFSGNSSDPKVKVTSKNLAYVLYTSGSTGTPKGVMIEHHSVLNRLAWMQKAYPIDKTDTLLQKTPITFDVSVWELFWWSFYGAKLVLLPKGGEKEPETIIESIDKFKVTTIHFVPSMFSTFIETVRTRDLFNKLENLNRIFLSGEALPLKLVNEFNEMREFHSLPDLINLYGPTEATVDVSYYNCPRDNVKNVYIGRPIDNTKLFVVNWKNIIQPIGVPGELLITGVNLARGYLNRPDLTNEKFIDFTISNNLSIRAYRSGDLVKLTSDGEIDYLGRLDNQVKIRGFRIELGEIEAKILEHPQVANCAVIVADKEEHQYLVAYVCLKPGNEIEADKLRSYLSGKLPEYMVPPYIIFLETLPLTGSGKLDRKSLPASDRIIIRNTIITPSTRNEKVLLDLWRDLLKIENISISDNFFDIGGNSLLAINLANLISKEFNMTLKTFMIFEYPSIKDQSEFLAGKEGDRLSSKNIEIKEKTQRKRNVNFKRYRDLLIFIRY